jgi:HPt (histidine-containing phosphotransfer) domain-containing protein
MTTTAKRNQLKGDPHMYESVITEALSHYGESACHLAKIVKKDLAKYSESMVKSIEETDKEQAFIAAHSCKSICSLIGVEEALNITTQMETTAKAGDMDLYKDLYVQFKAIYKELDKALKVYNKDAAETL